MHFMYIFIALFVLFCGSSSNAALLKEQIDECQRLLPLAEEKTSDWVYEYCDFNNAGSAWEVWPSVLTEKGYRRAMYELCARHPQNALSNLYCQKSADLGYVPALYELALRDAQTEKWDSYVEKLSKIIKTNPLDKKIILSGLSDEVALRAYRDLGIYQLQSGKMQQAVDLLQVAADLDDADSAHVLAILFLWKSNDEQTAALSSKYWAKAMLLGCVAAEDNWNLYQLYQEGRIRSEDIRTAMEERMFSCVPKQAGVNLSSVLTVDDCDCVQILAWAENQKDKPFEIVSIEGEKAVVKERSSNKLYYIKKMDGLPNDYFVEDIQKNTVVLKRLGKKSILIYREDAACIPLCENKNIIFPEQLEQLPVQRLIFTRQECEMLADNISELNDLSKPFAGLPECQLQDWATWGKRALDNENKKHLYLLGNYPESQYIPSYLANAAFLKSKNNAGNDGTIANLYVYATQQEPEDALSYKMQQKAYCEKTLMHMDGVYADDALALSWGEAGARHGNVQCMNMLGVLYARGTEQRPPNPELALKWFKTAQNQSEDFYMEAKYNERLLNEKMTGFKYGDCDEIIEKPVVKDIQGLAKLFGEK